VKIIPSRLNSRNAIYIIQKLLASFHISENVRIKVYKTLIPLEVLYIMKLALSPYGKGLEIRMRRRIFVFKERGRCRNFHNDELHNSSSSTNNITVIRSGKMRWAGNVARIE
jgi:hypothetical protein